MEFSAQINDFQTLGIYDYKFDEVGNVMANSSSMEFSYNYLSLPLLDCVYNNKAIEAYFDPEFREFVVRDIPADEDVADISEVRQENTQLLAENENLRAKIEELISQSESDPTLAQNLGAKRIILDLRISLGEGESDSDFSPVFPYLPTRKE